MQTEAFWFPFICYHCLSWPMWSPVLRLAACLCPYPTSTLPFFLQRASLRSLSRRQNQSCSHIVKDWLYGFFCLYKQFSDPHRKKVNSQSQTGRRDGKLQRDAKEKKRVESWGMWAQWVWEAVVYCFTSTMAEINIFMYINSLNRLPHCKATDGRMLFCLLGEPLLNQIEYLKLHSIFFLYQQWVQWPRHSW